MLTLCLDMLVNIYLFVIWNTKNLYFLTCAVTFKLQSFRLELVMNINEGFTFFLCFLHIRWKQSQKYQTLSYLRRFQFEKQLYFDMILKVFQQLLYFNIFLIKFNPVKLWGRIRYFWDTRYINEEVVCHENV